MPDAAESQMPNWEALVAPELMPHLQEILRSSRNELVSLQRRSLSPLQIEAMAQIASQLLHDKLAIRPPTDHSALATAWNEVVTEVYQRDDWLNAPTDSQQAASETASSETPPAPNQMVAFLRAFAVPTFLIKTAILYFGVNYSRYPGEGYGWGLIAAIVLSLTSFAVFIWKQSQKPEEE